MMSIRAGENCYLPAILLLRDKITVVTSEIQNSINKEGTMTDQHSVAGQSVEDVAAPILIELGRCVRSPKYGKGFIWKIEGDTIRVRFWKSGYKTFHKPEDKYPFELLDEVRSVKTRSMPSGKEKRAQRCPHRNLPSLCLKCAGLRENDIEQWGSYRTTERYITPRGSSLNFYRPVKISRADCVLVSRPENTVPATEISDWYRCRGCERVSEVAASEDKLKFCPMCNKQVTPIPEPFQRTQFSREVGNGAEQEDYGGAANPARTRHNDEGEIEDAIRHELYVDPNSRFQRGGTGHLRIPLGEARSTRGDAPEWFPRREKYLRTLRKSRSERAERILYGFFVEEKTDDQIAESERWTKDAIKKERKTLVERGNHFFRLQ
jgi:hypothetical protein